MRFKIVGICSVEALSAIPKEPVKYDLDQASLMLEREGHEVENIGVMVSMNLEGREVTIYRNGRISIYPAETKEIAARIAGEIYDIIEEANMVGP